MSVSGSSSSNSGASSEVSSLYSLQTSIFSENFHESWVHTAKHAIYLLFSNINNHGKSQHPTLQLVLRLLEFLQLLSLCCVSWYQQWGAVDDKVLQYFGYVWNFGIWNASYKNAVVLLSFAMFYIVVLIGLGGRLMLMFLEGEEKKSRKSVTFSYLLQMYSFLYLPLLAICVSFLNCTAESGNQLASFSVECIGTTNSVLGSLATITIVLSVSMAWLISILYFPWSPQRNNYVGTVNGRIWFLLFCAKTLLGLSASFFYGHQHIRVARTLIHSLILLGSFATLLGWTLYSFPFYHFNSNLVACGLFGSGFVVAALRLISVAIPDSFVPFIIVVLLIPPAIIGSIYFAKKRLLKLGTPIPMDPKLETDQPVFAHFNNEFEVEISTRFAYWHHTDESDIDTVTMIYLNASDQFPQSIAIRVAHAVFLLPFAEELQLLSVVINRGKKTYFSLNNWDYEYLLFCLDKSRKEHLYELDGGVEEIQKKIRQAMKYQDECTKFIRAFWVQLMKEQDLAGLTDIVAQIERSEIHAEGIYKKLLIRFPKNTRVLRAYGLFLEEIKNDIELAQMAYRSADEVEEEKARHNKNKKNFKRKKKGSPTPVVPLQDNFVSSEEEELPPNVSEWSLDKEQKDKIKPMNPSQRSKRLEKMMHRKYKQNIEKSKSTALRKLSIAVLVTIVVLFVDLLVLYVGTRVTLNEYHNSLERVDDVADTRTLCQRIVMNTRQAQIAAKESRFNDTIYRRERVQVDAVELGRIIEDKIMEKYGNAEISHHWLDPIFNQSDYIPTADANNVTRVYTQVSLIDISMKFVGYSLYVASMNETEFVGARTNVPFRFVVDNGLHTILNGYIKAAELETHKMESYGARFNVTLSVLLGISVGILIAVIVVFFVPALRKIREERAKALTLFLAIPKSTIANIYDSLSSKEDEVKDFEEEQYQEEMAMYANDIQSQSGGIPIIRKLILRYSISVIAVLILVSALFAIPVAFVVRYDTLGIELNYSGARAYLADRMVMLGWELIHNGNITWAGGRSEVRYYMNETNELMTLYNNAVQFGNSDLKMRHVATYTDHLRYITFRDPCTLYNTDSDCHGTRSLIEFFLRDSVLLANQLDNQLVYNNTVMLGMVGLETQLADQLELFIEGFKDFSFSLVSTVVAAVSIIYAISFPVLLFCYFILRPLERRVKEENMRTMKMLLMIPIDVIDQVEEIKTYLDAGLKGDLSDKKFNQILQDKLERSKKIIDASTDAIVVINDAGFIEVFNPAAEKLFGYSCQEVLNQNVTILMPEDVGIVHQSYIERYRTTGKPHVMGMTTQQTAKTKDGTLFPVSLSLSATTVGVGRNLYAGFFKDITAQKEYEKELMKERDYSEQLLSSLLPVTIAKQLKEEIRDQGSEGVLIAEAYKEVTVLFADIVGFTTLSGKIRPTELVQLLNKLFSKWDALAGKYGVEKIKTIGDCYMAASGVPLRSLDHALNMMELANEMLVSIEELNKEMKYNIQVRIGINSGPVVAGVIGTKKMAFDLWGDTVNVASRMESTGVPGRIQVSPTTFELLKEEYIFEERGRQEVKGKGVMLTYLYKERRFERTTSGHKIRRQTFTPMGLQSTERNVSGSFEMKLIKTDEKEEQVNASSEEEMKEIQPSESTPLDEVSDPILDVNLSMSSEESQPEAQEPAASPVITVTPPSNTTPSKSGKDKKLTRNNSKLLSKSRSQELSKTKKVNFK